MAAKPKLKTKESQTPLFWQSQYEFVAPYDFDDCIQRINALGNRYGNENSSLWNLFLAFGRFGIDSQEDNGGVFNFKISGTQSKVILQAQLNGQLIYENDNQTRIKIRTGFTQGSTASLIALFPVICVLIFITTHASNSFELLVASGISTAIFCFILLIDLFSGHSLKAQLHDDLREALSAPKAPRSQTFPP